MARHIARAAMALTFPARFNAGGGHEPLPCGFRNDRTASAGARRRMIQRYISKSLARS